MPIYSKTPLDAAGQVAHLQARGMTVSDVAAAEVWLERIGLYRFKGYAHHFKSAGRYLGVSFEEVAALMALDDALKLHVLRGVQILEIALRVGISEHMTLAHHAHWYADPAALPRERHLGGRPRRMLLCAEDLAPRAYADFLRSHDDSPRHYRAHYDLWVLPPSWIMAEVLSFGTWSKVYASLDVPDRDAISLRYGVHRDDLQLWLQDLTVLRNICAHHSRLWNRTFRNARLYEPNPVTQPLRTHSYRPAHPETTLAPRLYAMHALLRALGETGWGRDLPALVNAFSPFGLTALGLRPGWEGQPEWR